MKAPLAHPKTLVSVQAVLARPHACYMLIGPRYSGKLLLARFIAESLGCPPASADYILLGPNDKNVITIEMAHNLVDTLGKRAFNKNGYRVVVVQGAETMTVQAQNALLKVIEEPPVGTLFLLLTEHREGMLPTIQSRCQPIFVRPVEIVDEWSDIARGRAGFIEAITTQPELLEQERQAKTQAETIVNASSFERIKLVDTLSTDKDRSRVIDWLGYLIEQQSRTNGSGQSLQSMQNYFIYDNAKLNAKHALMELMVRL